jgi:hypothetical protein
MDTAVHPGLRIADAENAGQLRSRFETILNVPQRVRLRLFLVCGLVDRRFDHPHKDIPPSMNQSSIAP